MNDKQRFQLAAVESLAGGVDPRTVVLVEGSSDQVALEALAERRGRELAAEGVAVVPMGGARNIRHFLELFGHLLLMAGVGRFGEQIRFRLGELRVGQ